MIQATLTSKGQLTIPKEVRERFDLQPGDRLLFEIAGGAIRLRIVKRRSVDELYESLPGAALSYPGREAERIAARRYLENEAWSESETTETM